MGGLTIGKGRLHRPHRRCLHWPQLTGPSSAARTHGPPRKHLSFSLSFVSKQYHSLDLVKLDLFFFSLSPAIFPSPQCRHCAIRRSQIMGFNRWEEGLCVSASRKVLTKEKSPVTVKLGCRRLGTWPCHSSFRSEVALQGTAAHPAGRVPAATQRPRSRVRAGPCRLCTRSRRALSPLWADRSAGRAKA